LSNFSKEFYHLSMVGNNEVQRCCIGIVAGFKH
jgi:hypothetical protein